VEYANWTPGADDRLALISAAAHHFTSSSFANVPSLVKREGTPYIELNPEDAAARAITDGMEVEVGNARGSLRLRAVIIQNAPRGVVVAPKGRWQTFSSDGQGINNTTSDALSDLAGGATFHDNLVTVRPVS
jgi:anaerobic selenocysteine-containing dehydrogenase